MCINLSTTLKTIPGTLLVVQWLRLHAPNIEGPGSISHQGTISHMPQVRPSAAKINKYIFFKILYHLLVLSSPTLQQT